MNASVCHCMTVGVTHCTCPRCEEARARRAVRDLVRSSRRDNGKYLLTEADARDMLRANGQIKA